MKKAFYLKLVASILISINSYCLSQDTCIVTKRGTENGFDTYLTSFASNVNCVNHTDFGGVAWTCNGSPCFGRCIIQFYMPPIPTGYSYSEASLDLYSNPAPYSNGGQAAMLGPNECLLQRITSPWVDNIVTWNTQPTTTIVNQVSLPTSNSSNQDYLNIDVTNLVGDIYADLSNNNGFMIRLNDEIEYRNMIFASSDVPDTSKHPTLEVCFVKNTGIKTLPNDHFSVYFDNETNRLELSASYYPELSKIQLTTLDGRVIRTSESDIIRKESNKVSILYTNLASGIYIFRLNGIAQKLIKQ